MAQFPTEATDLELSPYQMSVQKYPCHIRPLSSAIETIGDYYYYQYWVDRTVPLNIGMGTGPQLGTSIHLHNSNAHDVCGT